MWNATKAIALLVLFIALAWWLEQTTSEAINYLKSIWLFYLVWGLGIVSGIILIVGLFIKNAEHRRQTGGVYRSRWLWWPVVVLLLVVIGIGAYEYFFPWSSDRSAGIGNTSLPTPPTTDTTFVVVVRPEQPVEVRMPPGWMIGWWGNKSRFTSHAVWRGSDKVQVFTVRSGVESAEIKIHRYHDPDPNWWRRQ